MLAMTSYDTISLHDAFFRLIIRVHPVPIWTTISIVPIIVFELATAEPASTYVVVMQGNVSAYFEAVKLLADTAK